MSHRPGVKRQIREAVATSARAIEGGSAYTSGACRDILITNFSASCILKFIRMMRKRDKMDAAAEPMAKLQSKAESE